MSEHESQLMGFVAKVVPFSGVFSSPNKTRQRGNVRSVAEEESTEGSEHESQFMGLIGKIVPFSGVFMNSSKTRQRMRSVPEDESVEGGEEEDFADMPETLEGTLFYRRGRSAIGSWKRRYVVLHLTDGGSLSCYRFTSKKHYPTRMLRKMYTTLHRRDSVLESQMENGAHQHQSLCLNIPPDVPWIARDIENDPASFVVELPASYTQDVFIYTGALHNDDGDDLGHPDGDSLALSFASPMNYTVGDHDNMSTDSGWDNDRELPETATPKRDKKNGHYKNKPLRLHFHCPRKGNEKALWLRALSELGRLSTESKKKRKLFGSLKHMARVSRIRSPISAILARESLQLDSDYRQRTLPYTISTRHLDSHREVEELAQSPSRDGQAKEYSVQPSYNYPHRWMTHQELRDDMILSSLQYHDLRAHKATSDSEGEIGSLRVEVLQCLGLPRREKAPDMNAVVYLVCGAYAFATDVIPNCSNPMWLSKMRRACVFPLFHAYDRFYVGVFDDDERKTKSEFVGRVALDLSRLRPRSTYDVTLPLRLSTHVYCRRQRGAIRLRLHLEWASERKALLSYLPKQIRMPKRNRPVEHVTVLCSSPKAFRNVAVTVHGAHLPGKFSTSQLRAAIKEFNFTRIVVLQLLRRTVRNTVFWENPAISLFTFAAWMHCIYSNAFSLVPAYILSFLFLHLAKNYARYAVELPLQQGFLPPTWEEMFAALLNRSDSQSIAPLDLYMQYSSIARASLLDDDHRNLVVDTHKPRGQAVFSKLDFLEGDDHFDSMIVDDNHLEFPFSNGVDYPRFTVKESLEAKEHPRRSKLFESGESSRVGSVGDDENGRSHTDSTEETVIGTSPEEVEFMPLEMNRSEETSIKSSSTRRGESEDQSISSLVEFRSCASPPVGEINGSLVNGEFGRFDQGLPKRPLPQQNIDIRYQSQDGDKKITEELQDIKEKVHELTFHLFNDKAYVVKDPNAQVWGKRRWSEKKRGSYDANKELEKALGVGQYSHSNPVIGRVGLYIEPIVAASMSLLCSFRALFNLFTWQDSFLSFWTSIISVGVIVVLFVFPWRLFMFVIGVISVGPQNWFLRMYRERRDRRRVNNTCLSRQASLRERPTDVPCVDQPVFHGHAPANQPAESRSVTSECAHHVVVPSSPFMYQRFYDWPPEPQFSRVKSDTASASPNARKGGTLAARSKSGTNAPVVAHPFSSSPAVKHAMHKRSRSFPKDSCRSFEEEKDFRRFESEGRQTVLNNTTCSTTHSPEVQQTWLQGQERKKDR